MALTTEQLLKLQSQQSSGFKTSGLTSEQLLKLQGQKSSVGQPKESKLYQGGFLQDVFDTLSVPQYALTGALTPGVSVSEAIKTKFTPSKALGIQSSAGKFITDVILDPLNFVGFLGATSKGVKALKLGSEATTLAKAAQGGEKALVTLGLPFSSKAMPLIKGTKVLEGMTKAGEALKSLPGVGRGLEAVGAAPYIKGVKNLDDIEANATNFKRLKALQASTKGVDRQFTAQAVREAQSLRDEYTKLLKRGAITESDLREVVERVSSGSVAGLKDGRLKALANHFQDRIVTLNKMYEKLGAPKLEGKTLKNVLTPELRDASKLSKPFSGQFREVGGNAGSENFARHVGLKDGNGKVTVANFEGTTRATLENGSKVRKISDDLYGTQKAYNVVNDARLRAKLLKEDVKAAESLAIARLKATTPEALFTRQAVSPGTLNKALEASGALTRFSEDPAEILFQQGKDIGKLRARQSFVQGVQDIKVGVALKSGSKVPSGWSRSKIKGLEGMIFPDTLVTHLDKTFKAFSNIEDVSDFVKLYDKLQNTWKGFATYFNPAFHTRNAVSNHWQLFLAGVDNPLAHVRGYRIELAIRKATKLGVDPVTFVKPEYKSYVKEFLENQGLRSSGAFTLDIDKGLSTKLINNPLGDLAGSAGETLENSSKLSLYLDKRLKGFNPEAAGREVRKYLFDYGDLTDFEKNFFKRVFPFYTWTRKNLPLQVAMLMQKPARISSIAKAKESIESSRDGKPLDEKYMPEWLREAYPIYFGDDANGLQRFIKLEGFLPTIDLNKLDPGRLKEVPFENLSPLIKTPMELISNYDFYFEKQISEYSGQKVGVPVPFSDKTVPLNAYLNKVLKNFRPLSELQKFSVDPSKNIQPSTQSQLINFLFGKTYQLDPTRQKEIFDYVQGQDISNISSDLDKARSTGQGSEEVQRLLDLLTKAKAGEGIKL